MNLKSNKAITLVALIITIIILLILAGVSLTLILGDNGLINKTQSSVNAYQQAYQNEQYILNNYEDIISTIASNGINEKENLNVEVIGCNLGTSVNIASGYKYVVIANSFWGYSSNNFSVRTGLVSQTNSTILSTKASQYKQNDYGAGTCLVFAKIEDTSQNAQFIFNSSDFNIILGVK